VLVDAELVEDLVDVGALDEVLGVERVDPVGVREDADVGSVMLACSSRSSASV
jgi:hypothetical protein